MGLPSEDENVCQEQPSVSGKDDAADHASTLCACAQCQALEARIAELESVVNRARAPHSRNQDSVCHASNSKLSDYSTGDGAKVGNYGLLHHVATGWTSCRTPTNACPW